MKLKAIHYGQIAMYLASQAGVWLMAHTAGNTVQFTVPAGIVTVLGTIRLVMGILGASASMPANVAAVQSAGMKVSP
jgi:hypothetical protein